MVSLRRAKSRKPKSTLLFTEKDRWKTTKKDSRQNGRPEMAHTRNFADVIRAKIADDPALAEAIEAESFSADIAQK